MRSLLLRIYRVIIDLHPASFSAEFGAEMMWIYEQECSRNAHLSLFIDVFRSLFLQHLRSPFERRLRPHRFEVASGPPLYRFAQAGIVVFAGIVVATSLMSSRLQASRLEKRNCIGSAGNHCSVAVVDFSVPGYQQITTFQPIRHAFHRGDSQ